MAIEKCKEKSVQYQPIKDPFLDIKTKNKDTFDFINRPEKQRVGAQQYGRAKDHIAPVPHDIPSAVLVEYRGTDFYHPPAQLSVAAIAIFFSQFSSRMKFVEG